ncbi:MAG: hypothetical protein JW987_07385 [Anaerolineaceae bacterium]|nr:hypothetical protein [Anaerolineaceae bacterium]
MNIKRVWAVLAVFMLLAVGVQPVSAQTYLFEVERSEAVITIDEQGLATVEYIYEFVNTPSADPIDFVDVGMPTFDYSLSNVSATIDGKPISDIEESPYVKPGVALGLGSNAIPSGQRGTVKVTVTGIGDILYKTNKVTDVEEDYASFNFSPNSFGSQYMQGSTNLTVVLILPPGMIETEPRWFTPQSWPGSEEPGVSYIDDLDRIVYEWNSPDANCYTQYIFGAAFPARMVPSSALQTAPLVSSGGSGSFDLDNFCGPAFCLAFAGFFGIIIYASVKGEKKRRMQYMPPKIAIEGNGVKRGLTAVEAAILMEQPLDKVMTMILFSVVKKGAATVTSREPLKIEVAPAPATELRGYEKEFLAAMQFPTVKEQRKALGEMVTGLVKSVAENMRGFSRKETVAFYQDIMRRAWEQVKAADTPEMKMKRYDEALDWTMLDKDFGDQSREVFSGGPVILPHWWGHYDPTFRPTSSGSLGGPSVSMPTQVGSAPGSSNLPSLPGADFAASVVGGIQNFSGQVLGDVSTFTSGVTNKTNPIPKSTSSSRSYRSGGGGGRSCACACACAGCACACAGGGR